MIKYQKRKRLEEISRMYYEQNIKQSDIAKKLNVSRPRISKMLDEAKKLGIVEIKIIPQLLNYLDMIDTLKRIFDLKQIVVIDEIEDLSNYHSIFAQETINLLNDLNIRTLGISWGKNIGDILTLLETSSLIPLQSTIKNVIPLIGNSVTNIREYHSNEIIRVFSELTKSKPYYLYAPAFVNEKVELETISQLEQYKQVSDMWEKLDTALVNIDSYPSTPDLGTSARFDDILNAKNVKAKLIEYYFDIEGKEVSSNKNFVLQIPLPVLRNCKNVIGVCNNISSDGLHTILKTDILTHIIITKKALNEYINKFYKI